MEDVKKCVVRTMLVPFDTCLLTSALYRQA